MIQPALEEDWAETRNMDNMVQYYKVELLSLRRGMKIVSNIPLGTRKMLQASGVIRRFGSKFELTEQGDLLLQQAS